jgi:hypothetical protein
MQIGSSSLSASGGGDQLMRNLGGDPGDGDTDQTSEEDLLL